jgi:FkbM family methyltransferase
LDAVDARVSRRDGGIEVGRLGAVLRKPADAVLIESYAGALKAVEAGARFTTSATQPVQAAVGDVRLWVQTNEEVQILEEVYVDGVYHFDLAGPLLILDIGMNAAYTAIFMALRHPDAVVCGFEPFGPTLRRAAANIALNPGAAPRIRAYPFGLSDADREIEIEYSEQWPGSVGVYGVPEGLKAAGGIRRERIELRDAGETAAALWREFPDRRIVLKVDCEGSEYAVFDRLEAMGLLDRVTLAMIECHRRAPEHDPAGLRRFLTGRGFACVHRDPDAPDISMLYAVRAGAAAGATPLAESAAAAGGRG